MESYELTAELIASVLPNTLVSVDEETPLAEKLMPYYIRSYDLLRDNLFSYEEPSPELAEKLSRVAVLHAFIKAVPALDIVATPTGFAVVSSDGLVPASKERVERLIAALTDNFRDSLLLLQAACIRDRGYRESVMGRHFCSTFLPYLRDVSDMAGESDIFEVYDRARDIALWFEESLAVNHLGVAFMSEFRTGFHDGDYDVAHPVVAAIRAQVRRYVERSLNNGVYRCSTGSDVWFAAETILGVVRQDPVLKELWERSAAKLRKPEPFRNNVKGGYYF